MSAPKEGEAPAEQGIDAEQIDTDIKAPYGRPIEEIARNDLVADRDHHGNEQETYTLPHPFVHPVNDLGHPSHGSCPVLPCRAENDPLRQGEEIKSLPNAFVGHELLHGIHEFLAPGAFCSQFIPLGKGDLADLLDFGFGEGDHFHKPIHHEATNCTVVLL